MDILKWIMQLVWGGYPDRWEKWYQIIVSCLFVAILGILAIGIFTGV